MCVCVRVRVCALNKEEEDDFFPFKSLLFFFLSSLFRWTMFLVDLCAHIRYIDILTLARSLAVLLLLPIIYIISFRRTCEIYVRENRR